MYSVKNWHTGVGSAALSAVLCEGPGVGSCGPACEQAPGYTLGNAGHTAL